MASKPPATAAGPSSTSRRQPMRQARTNPRKNAAVSTLNGRGGPLNGTGQPTASNQPPAKFYPALTAFTDAIDALPSETIRHFTLLREVDAKACAPEATLRSLIASAQALSPPDDPYAFDPALEAVKHLEELQRRREEFEQAILNQMEIVQAGEGVSAKTIMGHPETRRARCAQIRALINDILVTLDEKIHVITTAFEALQKHLQRVEHAFTYVQHEIPDVFRLGSKDHWAYNEPVKRGAAAAHARAAERAQREAEERQHQQQQRDIETPNSRSETRREALRQKAAAASAMQEEDDHGNQSRGEQSQPPTKKLHGNSKIRREQEASAKRLAEHQSANGGGGLVPAASTTTTTAPPQQKRRKTATNVKDAVNAPPTEKPTATSTSGKGIVSPRAATPAASSSKRGGKTTTGTAGRGGRRNAAASAAHSPNLASSPVHTTFSSVRDLPTNTPAATTNNTSSSSAAGSDIPTTSKTFEPSSSRPGTSSKGKKDKDKDKDHKDDDRPVTSGSVSGREKKASASEIREVTSKSDDKAQDVGEKAPQVENAKPTAEKEEKPKKRRKDDDDRKSPKPERKEEKKRKRPTADEPDTAHEEKATRHSKARPSTADSAKDKHPEGPSNKRGKERKKVETVMKVEEQVGEEDERMLDEGEGDGEADVEEGDGEDEDEPVYCYCQQVSYGEMVACDGESCAREWFHLDCVGLQQAPKGKAKWYCDECKENMTRGRRFGSKA